MVRFAEGGEPSGFVASLLEEVDRTEAVSSASSRVLEIGDAQSTDATPKWVASTEKVGENLIPRPELSGDILFDKRTWRDLPPEQRHRGQFTEAEDEALKTAIRLWAKNHGESYEDALDFFVFNDRVKDAWLRIAAVLPNRRVESVIFRVQGSIYPWPRRGRPWSLQEDQMLLKMINAKMERKVVAKKLGRYWRTCYDHYQDLRMRGMLAAYEAMENHPLVVQSEDLLDPNKVDMGEIEHTPGLKRDKPMKWTPSEDNALLQIIEDVCGVKYPLSGVPWTLICEKLRGEATLGTMSHHNLRHRYLIRILPRSGRLLVWGDVCKRSLIRHLRRLLRARSDITWKEVSFRGMLPFWPATCMRARAETTLLSVAGLRFAAPHSKVGRRFFESDWRTAVSQAYKVLGCKQFEEADINSVENYLGRLRALNGGDREDIGELPPDCDMERLQSIRLQHLRELRLAERKRRRAEEVDLNWDNATSLADVLEGNDVEVELQPEQDTTLNTIENLVTERASSGEESKAPVKTPVKSKREQSAKTATPSQRETARTRKAKDSSPSSVRTAASPTATSPTASDSPARTRKTTTIEASAEDEHVEGDEVVDFEQDLADWDAADSEAIQDLKQEATPKKRRVRRPSLKSKEEEVVSSPAEGSKTEGPPEEKRKREKSLAKPSAKQRPAGEPGEKGENAEHAEESGDVAVRKEKEEDTRAILRTKDEASNVGNDIVEDEGEVTLESLLFTA